MALGSNQPVTEMINMNISCVVKSHVSKADKCADCLESWETQPPGTLRSCPDL